MGMDESRAYEVAFPALLRGARAAYGAVVQEALSQAGYSDVPRNGSFVIGAIARTEAPLSRIIASLGVSKQATGQLAALIEAHEEMRGRRGERQA